ncbi:hypothetical protein E2562_021824 [Oryza meyeriana var. granulata]|uniref:Uncharacterized protein n=1 Tax=Oryza meyeriana var. granulata TaxID=110450 RepID=A0A6G1ENA1_9ORYZ|nr:hypothetical protein E2562_021824 [Oryza meyeriana var. granulata]
MPSQHKINPSSRQPDRLFGEIQARFERFAHGAAEFLRFMEFGIIGSIDYMIVDPLNLIGHLLTGKALQYENSRGRRQ